MKRVIYIILLSVAGATSCSKYLEVKPLDFVSPATYYNNLTELTAALMSVYSELGNINLGTYSRFLSLEAPSSNDEQFPRGANTGTTAALYNASNAYINFERCWTNFYAGINRANLLLENLDRAQASKADKDNIRGEALFLRGYYYFMLVSLYGDVPLKLESLKSVTDVNIARTPAKKIYDQVIADMTTAAGLVKSVTDIGHPGRVSKTAVAGVLSRVCLHAAGRLKDVSYYTPARDWALQVMNPVAHTLHPDYKQIFINHTAEKYDTEFRECIWEVEFTRGSLSPYQEYEFIGATIGIRNDDDKTGYMQGAYLASGVLFNRYGTGDLRRDWAIAPFYYSGSNRNNPSINYSATYVWGRYIGKWRREYQTTEFNKNFGGLNWPLLRYADVLLMYAEADNEVSGGPTAAAYDALNQVRRRAYGKPLNAPDAIADAPAGLTKTTFLNYIQDERSRELCFEGHRKLDLIRWGTFFSTIDFMKVQVSTVAPAAANNNLGYSGRAATLIPYSNVTARDTLFPIPILEISLNNLIKQNKDW